MYYSALLNPDPMTVDFRFSKLSVPDHRATSSKKYNHLSTCKAEAQS